VFRKVKRKRIHAVNLPEIEHEVARIADGLAQVDAQQSGVTDTASILYW